MFNKLIQKKKIFLIAVVIVFAIFWMLTLIFGNGEDKAKVLILSFILPFIMYGFVRLMFKVVRINAPLKFMKFGAYFFLITGAFSVVMSAISFVRGFPNGLSPTLTACLGLIIAVLDEVKKTIEIENK